MTTVKLGDFCSYFMITLVFLVLSPNHMVDGLMLMIRRGVPSEAVQPHGSLLPWKNSSSCAQKHTNQGSVNEPTKDFSHLSLQYVYIERHTRESKRDLKFDLGVSTGVDLCPAVGCHVAQDLRHLLEHSQTPHVDLSAESNNKIRKRLIELLAGAT